MPIRFYILPMQSGAHPFKTGATLRSPGYVRSTLNPAGLESPRTTIIDYGETREICIARVDAPDATHAALAAMSDVTQFPANLQGTVTNAAAIEARMEAASIPGDWVQNGMTWATVLRGIAAIFLIAQRFGGDGWGSILDGVNLSDPLSSIPAGRRQELADALRSMGIDTSGLTLQTTIRTALRSLAQQVTMDIHIAGEVLGG